MSRQVKVESNSAQNKMRSLMCTSDQGWWDRGVNEDIITQTLLHGTLCGVS